MRVEGVPRETLIYFLFAVVATLVLLSLPIFAGRISSTYLLLILFAVGVVWFIVRILYYRRLREQETQVRQPQAE